MKTPLLSLINVAVLLAAMAAAPLHAAGFTKETSVIRPGAASDANHPKSGLEGTLGIKKAPKDAQRFGEGSGRVYETAEEIKAMARCKATVVERSPCGVYLRTTGTNGFYIGSPGSKADVGRFLDVLKDGETYIFPDVFLEYQKKHHGAGQ